MSRPAEISLLLQCIHEGYSRKSWHGPNLRGSIVGLTVKQAARRPGRNRHNIWEIVVHCAYWKYAVRRRILGEKRGSFSLKGSNWFTRPEGRLNANDWKRDVMLLDITHRSLVEAIGRMSLAQLNETLRAGSPLTNRQLITGIAMHDVYHAGQIQLIKRMMR